MRWTDEDIQFLQDNIKTMSKADIAVKLNRSEAAITGKLRQLTLTTPAKVVKLSRLQKNYIEQNSDKLTPEEIAEDLEMNLEQVKEIVEQPNKVIMQPKKPKTQIQRMHDQTRQSTKNVTIMTEGISERGDEVRRAGKQRDLPHIHQIYED